jgi:integrase
MNRNDANTGMVPERPCSEPTKEEKRLARRRFQRGKLIELAHGWSVRFYEDRLVDGVRTRLLVQKFLGTEKELPTKPRARAAAQEALAAVNDVSYRPRSTTTFRVIAKQWMEDCKTRKRKPIKPSTIHNWTSILKNHVLPILGEMPLGDVGNQAMKTLVEVLAAKNLSPQTIRNITLVVKLVKSSATDADGGELFPTKWNHRFIDMPLVDEAKQNKPTFTAEQVAEIVKATNGRIQMAVILFAASGLRCGELLALECRHFDGSSIRVEQEVWNGRVLAPKTPNARRVVDLHPEVAALLKAFIGDRSEGFVFRTNSGKPLSQTNVMKREFHPILESLKISKRGFHCFRRFRNTHVRNSLCPDGLLKFWMGHAAKDMSDRYDRVREDVQFRRDVAASMGVGFELPKTLAPKPVKPKKSKLELSLSSVKHR